MELIVITISNGVISIPTRTAPNYVVPTSNFSDGQYLLGVPCKVLSDQPYKASMKTVFGNTKVEDVIDVRSCVTGLEYTIPIEWCEKYDSLVEANDNAQIIGHHFPEAEELIGKPYWPMDNSFNEDSNRNWADLYKKKCEIVSTPFEKSIDVGLGKMKEYTFIMVKYNGKIYRTLFGEWALIEP